VTILHHHQHRAVPPPSCASVASVAFVIYLHKHTRMSIELSMKHCNAPFIEGCCLRASLVPININL